MSLGQQGVLQSPNFPHNYPTNMNIKWTFVAENHSSIIQMNFVHIILEEDYDTLTVCLKDVCSDEEKIVLTGNFSVLFCLCKANILYRLYTQVIIILLSASCGLKEGT